MPVMNDIIPVKKLCVVYRVMFGILKEHSPTQVCAFVYAYTHTDAHTNESRRKSVWEEYRGQKKPGIREIKSKCDHNILYIHMELSTKFIIFHRGLFYIYTISEY